MNTRKQRTSLLFFWCPWFEHVECKDGADWAKIGWLDGNWKYLDSIVSANNVADRCLFILHGVDKNSDLDMNKGRQTDGSNGTDKSAAAAPMSQISGVRRLQQSNSIVGVVPTFGVEVANEQPLAEVRHFVIPCTWLTFGIIIWHVCESVLWCCWSGDRKCIRLIKSPAKTIPSRSL